MATSNCIFEPFFSSAWGNLHDHGHGPESINVALLKQTGAGTGLQVNGRAENEAFHEDTGDSLFAGRVGTGQTAYQVFTQFFYMKTVVTASNTQVIHS